MFGPPAALVADEHAAHALEQVVFEDALLIGEVLADALDLPPSRWRGRALSFSTPSRVNTRTSMTVPSMPGGTRSEVSLTSDAFSPKIARSSFSSGVSWVSPFGVTLPTRMSPAFTSAPMKRDARLVQLRESALSPTFGMSAVISSGPSFVSRATQVSSSMWIGGEAVFFHHALGDEDRVFEVVAVPGHERDEQVLAERELAEVGGRAVGQHVAARDVVTRVHQRTLVDTGVLVRTRVLRQVVDVDARLAGGRLRRRARAPRCGEASTESTMPPRLATTVTPESMGDGALHAGTDERLLARRVGTA